MSLQATLYEQDLERWTRDQVDLLRQGNIDQLDVDYLIAELENMGKSSLRALESCFIILIAHLLKWQYQLETLAVQWKDFEGKSWRNTIIEQRTQLCFLIEKAPSLKSSLQLAREEACPPARRLAIKETGMPPGTFPTECPYRIEELLDEDFFRMVIHEAQQIFYQSGDLLLAPRD